MTISAEHGQNVGDLLDAALELLPRQPLEEDPDAPLRLALVGRPNVGKSSLLNRLLGQERAVVSDIPGTTRDSVDSLLERGGQRYLLVDTAGIRRNRLLKENDDHVSVVLAKRSIERAEVAVLVLDAAEGLREMDATIGGYVADAGRAVVLAVNKWDLKDELGLKQRQFEEGLRERLKFLPFASVVYVSARSGKGLATLLQEAQRARESWLKRVTTGELNRLLAQLQRKQAPKAKGAHAVTILFGAQIGTAPPTFALSINHPVDLHFSYLRYVENQIRERFGFGGTPIVLKVRFRRH